MKNYIVYVNGNKVGMIKAASHNAAEKKAQKMYPDPNIGKAPSFHNVSVEYTEV